MILMIDQMVSKECVSYPECEEQSIDTFKYDWVKPPSTPS